MTRARRAAKGLVTPPPLHRWMEAVLLLCVSLVQGVATTFGMRFNRRTRDWHMDQTDEALPQTTSDIHLQKDDTSNGVILGPVPRISVRPTRGLANTPHEASNQDARHKPEHDVPNAATRTSPPPPNGGGAARTPVATRAIRWGTARTQRTDSRGRRQTVPHLSCAPCEHHARISSPARGRMRSAHA